MRTDIRSRSESNDPFDGEDSIAHLSLVLAHRLRGLVASIEGFTDLLNDSLMDSEQRELAMKIMEGTARIESVLADLQLYGESLDPVMLPVRVDDVLRELFVPLVEEDLLRIDVRTEPEVGSRAMLADPFLLRQALLILIQNALEAERGQSHVRLAVNVRGTNIRFEVWNGGVLEIDEGAEVIFTPFFTTKAHNLGVGLSIARRIARLHDAAIELTIDDEREETCFAFVLPGHSGNDL